MKFDYNTLKSMAGKGSLGQWLGRSVYVCSKDALPQNYENFYILYDDGNKIVAKDKDNNFYCYGVVNKLGVVNKYNNLVLYKNIEEKVKFQVEEEAIPVIGDVKIGLDIEEALKQARKMNIEDLLKGFNYGL